MTDEDQGAEPEAGGSPDDVLEVEKLSLTVLPLAWSGSAQDALSLVDAEIQSEAPRSGPAMMRLLGLRVIVLLELSCWSEALCELDRIEELMPPDVSFFVWLAFAYQRVEALRGLGEFARAADLLSSAMEPCLDMEPSSAISVLRKYVELQTLAGGELREDLPALISIAKAYWGFPPSSEVIDFAQVLLAADEEIEAARELHERFLRRIEDLIQPAVEHYRSEQKLEVFCRLASKLALGSERA